MSHATAVIELKLNELPEHPSARTIMDTAVRKWYDEEAERYEDARQSYPGLRPIASKEVAQTTIEDHDSIGDQVSKIIPLTADYAEKTSTVRLTVTGEELADLRRGAHWALLQSGRFGSDVVEVKIDSLPKPRAPRAEATPGKTITVYRITDSNGYPFRQNIGQSSDALTTPHPTQAAARAAAIDYMAANPKCSQLAVQAFVQRDTGSAALVTITRPEPESSTASFKVTTQKPKPSAKVTGYLVSFDYHS